MNVDPTWPEGWLGHLRVGEPARGDTLSVEPGPDGFVHLSTPAQLAATVGRFFAEVRDVHVVIVDPSAVDIDLRWEEGEPGELFPHAYRPIPAASVVAVVPWRDPSH
jgi:uncharacterized protein (DUF952 family)